MQKKVFHIFTFLQAKYIAQIIVTGSQIVGRAFARAVRNEFQASQAAAEARRGRAAGGGGNDSNRKAADAITGMSVQVGVFLTRIY